MKILESKFVQGFIKMANDGYQQGWHERNGGNLSYRLKPEEVEMIKPRLNAPGEWTPIGVEVPGLAEEFFLVTGSGKYFRNIIVDPEVCLAIIELDETGTNYRIRWGLVEGGRPTSELPTHLMNHEVKKKLTNGKHRVIYHAHTTNTIALTFVLPLDDKIFTRELWESATECPVVFPDGVGVVGWMVPGGREIAVKTAELMKKYDVVIWAHHGMFCSGEDFDLTFGLLHTVEKSAEILVKIGGYLVFYSILILVIRNNPEIPAPVRLFFSGTLEITTGIRAVSASLTYPYSAIAAAAVFSFGGFSAMSQTNAVIRIHRSSSGSAGRTVSCGGRQNSAHEKTAGLSIRQYLLWKIAHASLTAAVMAVLTGVLRFSIF